MRVEGCELRVRVRGYSPDFPKLGIVRPCQSSASGLGTLHVLAMYTPFLESLSSSESDRGKAG